MDGISGTQAGRVGRMVADPREFFARLHYNIIRRAESRFLQLVELTRKRVRAGESKCVIVDGSRLSGLTKPIKNEGKNPTRVFIWGVWVCVRSSDRRLNELCLFRNVHKELMEQYEKLLFTNNQLNHFYFIPVSRNSSPVLSNVQVFTILLLTFTSSFHPASICSHKSITEMWILTEMQVLRFSGYVFTILI
jgi:hypothetical protein